MATDEDDPRQKMTPAASEGRSIASSKRSNKAMKLAIYHAKLILGSYRADDANDPEIYVTAIAHLLSRYPSDIGAALTDPKDGIAGKCKWLPAVSEVREEADRIIEAQKGAEKRQQDLREQWRLRDQVEREEKAETPEHRRKVAERIKNELRGHGFQFEGDEKIHPVETPESVMKKLNLTPEQWTALPNARPVGEWNNLMDNHAKRDTRNPAIIQAEEEAEWFDHIASR